MIQLANRYALDGQIGQGGMGTVFKGQDLHTGGWIAAKRLRPEALAAHPDLLERFIREGEALARLNHPNIVKMLAAVEDEGDHYLILEYIAGGDLGDLLRTAGKLPVGQTLQVGIELADALTRAHYLKIVHRDLKPANILLDADGTPKLTDFGIAHIGTQSSITHEGLAIGTPDYMAPETVNGDEADERADIWGLGVILFEMLAGVHPFRGEGLTATLVNVVTRPTPDLEALRGDVPVALADLIYRMLAKDREARISSVRVVGAELEALIRGAKDSKRTAAAVTPPAAVEIAEPPTLRFNTPTPPSSEIRHNLPAQPTPFVGRENELAEVARLIGTSGARLVTILGAGGMGKTRLAIQAAETLLTGYPDGVYFFPLAQLKSADGIGPVLMDTLGMVPLEDGRAPLQQMIDFLRPKRALLIFDNFEHVIEAATIVGAVIEGAPDVRVIATSRERLNLSGETIYALNGMDIPDFTSLADALRYSAVQLWLQSARRANPGYQLAEADLPAVRRIGRRVDGLPLGIILAASWADNLSADEIADEIDKSLDFLESELRDLPDRQRSMRAVFEYSYVLLPENERDTFLKLPVFMGGFTREAAQAVSGATLRVVTGLQNKSLIKRDPASGRYEMHELVREYAQHKLRDLPGGDAAVHDLHSAYYCDLLARRMSLLFGADELKTVMEIDTERGNVQAAQEWAAARGEFGRIAQALPTLAIVFESKGFFRQADVVFGGLVKNIAPRVTDDFPLLDRLRVYRALMVAHLGEYGQPRADVEKAIAHYRDQRRNNESEMDERQLTLDLGLALGVFGFILTEQGHYRETLRVLDEAQRIFHESGLDAMEARTETLIAYNYFLMGETDRAKSLYEKLLVKYKAMQMDISAAQVANNLGEVLHATFEDERAAELFQQALDTYTAYKNQRWQAVALLNLGGVAHRNSHYRVAEGYNRRALEIFRETGDQRGTADALNRLGGTVYWFGRYREAIDLHGQAYEIFRQIGNPKGAADALILRAMASSAAGEYAPAHAGLRTALELRQALGNPADIADAQQCIGLCYMDEGDLDNARVWLDRSSDTASVLNPPDMVLLYRYRMSLGMLLGLAGRWDEAQPLFEAIVPVYEQIKLYMVLAQAYAGIGFGLRQQGRPAEALAWFQKGLEAATRSETPGFGSLAMLGTAAILAQQGKSGKAVEIMEFVNLHPTTHAHNRRLARRMLDQTITEAQPPLTAAQIEAAKARGAALHYEDVVAELIGSRVEAQE